MMATLFLAILLGAGLFSAKLCRYLQLPAITGYILAGLLLGPSGFKLIDGQALGHDLQHFTRMAMILIAFGVGEHIELKKLRAHAKSLLWIGLCEAFGACLLTGLAIFFVIRLTGFHVGGWLDRDYLVLALFLGAVAIPTAPGVSLLLVRNLKASGPLTSTLMGVVATNNGLAITTFGLVISVVHQLLGRSGDSLLLAIGSGLWEVGLSLLLGVCTGFLLDLIVKKMGSRDEIMTAGLALLLCCSEIARLLHLSPLLAGMAAGFSLVNRAERDVRIFRALNRFEPPLFILFFTLAGAHLDIRVLGSAVLISLTYFLARITGKISGVALGGSLGGAPLVVRRYLGLALVPQADVAIGLIFLVASEPGLARYSTILTPVVLAGVLLSELIGPITARFAVTGAGEAHGLAEEASRQTINGVSREEHDRIQRSAEGVRIVPWSWEKLASAEAGEGVVAFGAAHQGTVGGVARFAAIFAHYFRAMPMAIRVQDPASPLPPRLFEREREEVNSMGYPLVTQLVRDRDVASGLVAGVEYNEARAVVLGYPLVGTASSFDEILAKVAGNVSCPVVVVRFFGELHTERILITVTGMDELREVYPVVAALAAIGEHQVHLLFLVQSGEPESRVRAREEEVRRWLAGRKERLEISVRALATEARVETISETATGYDLVVMGAKRVQGIKKFFFGSLVDSVAKTLQKTLLVVYAPDNGGQGEKSGL